MTPALLASNLWSWSLEIAILVAAAAMASRLLVHPESRLRFWQGVLVASLLLPVAAPWKQPPSIARDPGGSVSIATFASDALSDGREPLLGTRHLLELVALGAIFRLLWLGVGLYRLRRLRTQATPLTSAPLADAGRIQWFESAAITGPVTFGWLRPSILLPESVQQLPKHLRVAIACHELVHVRRRDWLFVIAEEVLRSLLWFHPAIWYALGQVQLAREHAVNRETVALTQDREGYLDALLAVAAHKLQPDVAPAPLFLKKRQLASRLAALVNDVKETNMSASRLFARGIAAISAACAAAVLAVWIFPLQSPAQVLADDPGITVDAGAKLLHRTPVHYPAGESAGGIVLVEATLNNKGDVADARVLSGPDELRKAVLASVLDWHYSTDVAPPPTVRVAVQFARTPVDAQASALPTVPTVKGGLPREAVQWTGTVSDIRFTGLSSELQQQVESRLPVHKGDSYNQDTYRSAVAALTSVDYHLRLTVQVVRDGGPVALIIALPSTQAAAPPPTPADASTPPQRIRVGGNAQSENLITKVTPVYPPLAKAAHVTGTVSMAVTINKDGNVNNVDLINGDPLLVPSALQAVKQWIYKPTLLNGDPVEVLTQVNINYTLTQ